MNTTENTNQVAQTIADQIGHRAFVMMGTTMLVRDERALSFSIKSRKFNKVRITLALDDTYTMEFFKFRGVDLIRTETVEGVYADNLHSVIEARTGLFLSL